MERLYLWPSSPAASLLFLWFISQLFLYAARVPLHRAFRNLGRAFAGGFRIVARWCRSMAADMRRRNQELLLAAGRSSLEGKISREFRRIEGTYTKELAQYPNLHRRLDDLVAKLDADYKECGSSSPPPPGWGQAVSAIASMPQTGDRVVQKLLEEIQKSAVAGEKKALGEFREATARRHKILSGMVGYWRELKNVVAETGKSVVAALESAKRVDGYMKSYEEIRKGDDSAVRALWWSSTQLFLVSLLVLAIAVGGAFVNFNLIALPMSELVPSGNRIAGMPVSTVAALVIVLMEIAAGIFAMEMLGVTNLFPKLELLPASRRRMLLAVSLLGLLLLAGIEASLAILREQIVESSSALKQSLAGLPDKAVAATAASQVPVVGQAVLGFILPWILAMVAVPLETLISTGGHMGTSLLTGFLHFAGTSARVLGHGARSLLETVRYLYDVYIILPLQAERLVRGGGAARLLDGEAPLAKPFELAAKKEVRQ